MVKTTCPACNKEFDVQRYRLSSKRAHPPSCSYKCAQIMLKSLGYKHWKTPERLKKIEKARQMYSNHGTVITTIARKLAISRSTVLGWARINGWKKFQRTFKPRTLYRKAAEEKLGRRLKPYEQVHHVNADIHDNSSNNIHVYRDAKSHSEGHDSIEKAALELLKRGYIEFNHDTGKYEACNPNWPPSFS